MWKIHHQCRPFSQENAMDFLHLTHVAIPQTDAELWDNLEICMKYHQTSSN